MSKRENSEIVNDGETEQTIKKSKTCPSFKKNECDFKNVTADTEAQNRENEMLNTGTSTNGEVIPVITLDEDVIDDSTKKNHDDSLSFPMNLADFNFDDFEKALSELEVLLNPDPSQSIPKDNSNSDPSIQIDETVVTPEDITEVETVILNDVLEDNLGVSPPFWTLEKHDTGLSVYHNPTTGVTTLSRPYTPKCGTLYNHRIPSSAIPCLQYRETLNEILNARMENRTEHIASGAVRFPLTKIETSQEVDERKSLDTVQVRNYLENLFNYENISIKPDELEIAKKNIEAESSFIDMKFVSCLTFIRDSNGEIFKKKEIVMPLSGKNFSSILQRFLSLNIGSPSINPIYEAVYINGGSVADLQLGNTSIRARGRGTTYDQARSEAAKTVLTILIPELKGKIEQFCALTANSSLVTNQFYISQQKEIDFSKLSITDPQIFEFSKRASKPSPFCILNSFLARKQFRGQIIQDYKAEEDVATTGNFRFTLTIGDKNVSIICRSKKDGKQIAAQAMLQMFHPELKNWGSLLDLFLTTKAKTNIQPNSEVKPFSNQKTDTIAKIDKPTAVVSYKQPTRQVVIPATAATKNNENQNRSCPFSKEQMIQKPAVPVKNSFPFTNKVNTSIFDTSKLVAPKKVDSWPTMTSALQRAVSIASSSSGTKPPWMSNSKTSRMPTAPVSRTPFTSAGLNARASVTSTAQRSAPPTSKVYPSPLSRPSISSALRASITSVSRPEPAFSRTQKAPLRNEMSYSRTQATSDTRTQTAVAPWMQMSGSQTRLTADLQNASRARIPSDPSKHLAPAQEKPISTSARNQLSIDQEDIVARVLQQIRSVTAELTTNSTDKRESHSKPEYAPPNSSKIAYNESVGRLSAPSDSQRSMNFSDDFHRREKVPMDYRSQSSANTTRYDDGGMNEDRWSYHDDGEMEDSRFYPDDRGLNRLRERSPLNQPHMNPWGEEIPFDSFETSLRPASTGQGQSYPSRSYSHNSSDSNTFPWATRRTNY